MSTPTSKPNILFVLADDMGYGDVSLHGSRIRTPNLDRFARTGLELTQHYVTPLCTPTRVCLMSGRHPGRFGRHATSPTNQPVFPDGYEILPAMLKRAGYETGIFGKWHLGSDPKYAPNRYGFDHSYGSLAGGVDPYTHRYKRGEWSFTWHRNGELVNEKGHVTDLIADEAVNWIHQRDQRKPWFCYVPFTAVHTPIKPREDWIDQYEMTRFDDDPKRDDGFKRYAAYASHMDAAFGRLIEALKVTDQYHNTLVVFTSDNGAVPSHEIGEGQDVSLYPGWQWETLLMGSNGPFRGRKGQMYDGGIHTTCIARWHGVLPVNRRTAHPCHMVDWMPTFASLLDIKPANDLQWDGRDMWPLLIGETSTLPDRPLYWNLRHKQFAARSGDWKLIVHEEKGVVVDELFNLGSDPGETCDVAALHVNVIADLRRFIAEQHAQDNVFQHPDARV
jgi:arylsulfatase A-like enzyme